MVADSRDVIGRVTDCSRFFPVDFMDLGMGWYPFTLRLAAGSLLEGEQTDSGLVLTPSAFLIQRRTDKPMWVGLLAIIHCAKGLIRYGAIRNRRAVSGAGREVLGRAEGTRR